MHTPTPWSVGHLRTPDGPRGWNDLPIHCGAYGVNGGPGNAIAVVHLGGDGALSNTPEALQDNAAFIVRACNCFDELLAACRKSLELLEVMAEQGPRDADAMEARDQTRAAITKAEAAPCPPA